MRARPLPTLAFAVTAPVLALCALFTVERTAHHDDAAQYWAMAGRLARTGDPFYVAAVDHKGPLWVGFYRGGFAISGDQRWFWFIMAAAVVALAVVVGLAVHRLLLEMAVGAAPALMTAGVLTMYLVFGPEGYSDTLYGRNITAALTAVAALGAYQATQAARRYPALRALGAGLLMGIATQTVLTTAATAVTLGVGLWVTANRSKRLRLGTWYLMGAIAGFATAPLWYAAKGRAAAFRTYFWDYNVIYGQSDTSLGERLGHAVTEFGTHYVTRPFLLIAPLAVLVALRFGRQRRAFAFAALWWLGELMSVAAPDRWFIHYWILLAAPTACLGALAFDQLANTSALLLVRQRRQRMAFVGLMIIASLYALPGVASGASYAWEFDGIEQNHAGRLDRRTPRMRAIQAVVDRYTTAEDPVYVWARVAEPYVALDRPAATRFDRNTWLTGEIYGSTTTATLPGVWEDLIDDLDASKPDLVIELLEDRIDPASPIGAYIAANYGDPITVADAHVYPRRGVLPANAGD